MAALNTVPKDYTNGTGIFPGSGGQTVTISANPNRIWFYVQNQDVGTVTVSFAAAKSSDGTACTATIYLAPGSSSGSQGGSDERGMIMANYLPFGQITVTGTGGQKVCILEN